MIKYPFPIEYIKISNNVNIAYCDVGSGETTLLFIHGLANYIPVFEYNISELSKHYRCIAIDLPGNGMSSRGNYPFTMVFYAEEVAKFIKVMGLNSVVLCGHSMGGHVSLLVALKFPELVDKMVLFAPSGLEQFTEIEKMWCKSVLQLGSYVYSDAMSLETAINQSYYHKEKVGAKGIINDLKQLMTGEAGRYWRSMVKANIEAMLDEQVYSFLGEVKVPVLLCMGDQDMLIPNKIVHLADSPTKLAKRAALLFKKCEVEIYKNCGHFVQIEEAAAVNLRIKHFLASPIPE
jgi:pimeloyl-ACP methyl ester carboxylesterase